MSKTTVKIEQATADEVTQWVSGIRTYASADAAADWLAAVGMKPPNGGGGIPIPDSVPGFDKVIGVMWDWTKNVNLTLDTILHDGIGCNGIVIISFVAKGPADNNNKALMSAIGYPSPNMSNAIQMCISTTPGVLYAPSPWCSGGQSPTLNYCVGTADEPWVTKLVPETQYFINLAGRTNVTEAQPLGELSCVPDGKYYEPDGSACEFRFQSQKPAGH